MRRYEYIAKGGICLTGIPAPVVDTAVYDIMQHREKGVLEVVAVAPDSVRVYPSEIVKFRLVGVRGLGDGVACRLLLYRGVWVTWSEAHGCTSGSVDEWAGILGGETHTSRARAGMT